MDVQKMLEILKRDYGIESKEELIERFESSKGDRHREFSLNGGRQHEKQSYET